MLLASKHYMLYEESCPVVRYLLLEEGKMSRHLNIWCLSRKMVSGQLNLSCSFACIEAENLGKQP